MILLPRAARKARRKRRSQHSTPAQQLLIPKKNDDKSWLRQWSHLRELILRIHYQQR